MDDLVSGDLLKFFRTLALRCLNRYAAYISSWERECLQQTYGWHNRIWNIYDAEIPMQLTELVGLLGLEQKLFFAVMENGCIRLTEVVFSVDCHKSVWQAAFAHSTRHGEISSVLAKLEINCRDLNEAIVNLTGSEQ